MSAGEARPHGLPGPLPEGERILWQGSPNAWALALRAFRCREIAIYFAIFALWRAASGYADGGASAAALNALTFAPAAAIALGLIGALAWGTARCSVYTVTDRRVVLSIGIALTATLNIPLKAIERVDVKTFGDGTGDLALGLAPDVRIAYLTLWPHARPWRVKRPEPSLRALVDPQGAAAALAEALEPGSAVRLAPLRPAAEPRASGSPQPRPAALAG